MYGMWESLHLFLLPSGTCEITQWGETLWMEGVWQSVQAFSIFSKTWECTVEWKRINVSVGRLTVVLPPFGDMWERTVGRNMNVHNVGKSSAGPHPYKNTQECTMKRNPMNVSNVAKPSGILPSCEHMWGHTLGWKPEYKDCDAPSFSLKSLL